METEQHVETPKQKRKPAKKRAKAVRAAPRPQAAKATLDVSGITPSDCPAACRADRCIISERGICAHPYKGGLQASLQNPDALRRLNVARRAIGKRKLDIADE